MRDREFGGFESLLVCYVFLGGQGEPYRGGVVLLFFIVACVGEEVGLRC